MPDETMLPGVDAIIKDVVMLDPEVLVGVRVPDVVIMDPEILEVVVVLVGVTV